jgi:hypothetical protein
MRRLSAGASNLNLTGFDVFSECLKRFGKAAGDTYDLVLDPFCGSG